MEVRAVGQDGQGGPFGTGCPVQTPVLAVYARNVRHHFDEPDHGERGCIHHGAHAGSLHFGPGTAEKLCPGERAAQFFDQTGGVSVAGGLTGGNKDFPRHSTVRIAELEARSQKRDYFLCAKWSYPTGASGRPNIRTEPGLPLAMRPIRVRGIFSKTAGTLVFGRTVNSSS